ncbi:MAG: dihydrolipoyl dehydrogenase [SAR202 cluster bacterium]|nr:dihydrolipoyl dehydrogenase [Chloroflexota bacterium]MDP6420344.1 dihydrolipoyl dehydrogenase [SAR202 cluster bacterium]HAL49169.1 dihydrolipoyl dehydrogenase [Dehalococcoidia bacterium]MDP6663635.1 dihydrolipoyl dehydrogenase [SAR202 cluster bacterium]MDP6798563.1 dihydrolipoyl dehydrogenase [SAR202 cluster bacterium]
MSDYDVIVLGSGPGGYVAAIRAGQLGLRTAIVERDALGGVCLNWGCIPSKALLRNAEVLDLVQHADDYGISVGNVESDYGKAVDRSREVVGRLTRGVGMLLKKNNVEHVQGNGKLVDASTVEITDSGRRLTADNIIIATGARQRNIPSLPIDGRIVITSREAIESREIPERVVIVGGGATGCEFAHIWNTYGAEVTIVELLPSLIPNEDVEIGAQLQRSFRRQGITFMTGATVDGIAVTGDEAHVSVTAGGAASTIDCDRVLVAVGVQGNIDDIGLDAAGIDADRGFIQIDERMQTNVANVYAIGDVTGKLLLAHVASAQGVAAVETIAGLDPPELDYTLMPRAIYCKPQVASFGLTEAQAVEQGHAVKIGKFPFIASGKALALGASEGFVKLVVDEEIGEILGGHMIGAEVTELLGELAMTRLLEGTTAELGWLVHPHPSISETIKEAALAAQGEAIHV